MKPIYSFFYALAFVLVLNSATVSVAKAHLMVAQNGTLNIVDDDVYVVLSLPVSAFSFADKNEDGLLSMVEFNTHRGAINKSVKHNIVLSEKMKKHLLDGILLSPVLSHHNQHLPVAKKNLSQITVMGKFSNVNVSQPMKFFVGLYGKETNAQTLKITATQKSEDRKNVFSLSPKKSASILFTDNNS